MKRSLVITFCFATLSPMVSQAQLSMVRPSPKILSTVMACPDARRQLFEAFAQARSQDEFAFDHALTNEIADDRYRDSLAKIDRLLTREVTSLSEREQVSTVAIDTEERPESESEPALHLARIEMRSQIDPEYERINRDLDGAIDEARAIAVSLNIQCEVASEVTSGEISDSTTSENNAQLGALKTMATAYQSCEALVRPPVTRHVDTVRGVIRSEPVDGVGWGRKYTDVNVLKRTHYYHQGITYAGSCKNQNAKPLVYDYGGTPVYTEGLLNLFRNQGGGPALGIDCSAFISAAVAVGGQLYREGTSRSPYYRRFVSRDFIDPTRSGWTCYKTVSVNSSAPLAAGDIGAVVGHVVMVDRVGDDPFGLNRVSSAAGCANLNYQNFDFTILQSSASKEHLGINRYLARDYLSESAQVRRLFVAYGRAACLSKFDRRTRNPSSASYGLIRHSPTSTCRVPAVRLVNESCVAGCSAR